MLLLVSAVLVSLPWLNEILYKGLANQLYRSNHKVGAHKEIRGLEHIDKIINTIKVLSVVRLALIQRPILVYSMLYAIYSQTPEAKMRGYKQGRFSF